MASPRLKRHLVRERPSLMQFVVSSTTPGFSLSFYLFLVVVSALYRKCGARRVLHDARSVNVFSLLLTNFSVALLSPQHVMPLCTHSPELRKRDEIFCGSTKISTRYMHSCTLLVLLLVAVIKRTNQTRNMLRERIPPST